MTRITPRGSRIRPTIRTHGGLIVADWPTHKVKQRRKRARRKWLKEQGLLMYKDAEFDRARGIVRDKGIV